MSRIMTVTSALGLLLLFGATAQPLTNNTSGTPECSSSSQCPSGKACVEEKCVDPCDGACGSNTLCHLIDLAPMCACKPGYKGRPFTGCTADPAVECVTDSQCPSDKACVQLSCVDPCQGACGLNTECTVTDHRYKCSCKQDFHYDPSIGCVPLDLPECKTNTQCLGERACVGQRCVDPCVGVCGNNTVCQVTNHFPACACSPGFTGDAFKECKPLCLPLLETKKISRTPKDGSKKRFVLNLGLLTWAEASAHCLSKDMDLAAIENEEEQLEVKRMIVDASAVSNEFVFYTSGVSDQGSPDGFVWTTTGKPVGYSNWKGGEPNGSQYHCLIIHPNSGFKWISGYCTERKRFICQYYEP